MSKNFLESSLACGLPPHLADSVLLEMTHKAPELLQVCERGALPCPCGEDAREVLGALLQGGAVECQAVDQDRYGRTVARCAVNGADLGGELVRLGWRWISGGTAREPMPGKRGRPARRGVVYGWGHSTENLGRPLGGRPRTAA